MKSAYELAMERLEKESPAPRLTNDQKAELADVETRYKAKEAEKQVFLGDLMKKAREAGEYSEIAALEEQLVRELRRIREQCEAEKEKVRESGGASSK